MGYINQKDLLTFLPPDTFRLTLFWKEPLAPNSLHADFGLVIGDPFDCSRGVLKKNKLSGPEDGWMDESIR